MKGFYSGFAAALVTLSLAGLFFAVLALSYQDVAALAELDAVRTFDRAQDAQDVLREVVADAAVDSAFAAHGCQPGPSVCAPDGFSSRVSTYASRAASRLSDGISVHVQVQDVSCRALTPSLGVDASYEVNASLTVDVTGFQSGTPADVEVSYRVDASNAPGGLIRVGAKPEWVVQFECP
ncbi:hypothetical protein HY572_03995 [Candidatus Micrarchaeota archaeon]|nr:hypothetical protein [Candidatus Micrarchaeota archaeon]